jgi:hypothetical protein
MSATAFWTFWLAFALLAYVYVGYAACRCASRLAASARPRARGY